jgi:hypothetical protein
VAEQLEVDPIARVIDSDLTSAVEPSFSSLGITSADAGGEIRLEWLVPGRGDSFDRGLLRGVIDATFEWSRETLGRLRLFAPEIGRPVNERVRTPVRATDCEEDRRCDDQKRPVDGLSHGVDPPCRILRQNRSDTIVSERVIGAWQ